MHARTAVRVANVEVHRAKAPIADLWIAYQRALAVEIQRSVQEPRDHPKSFSARLRCMFENVPSGGWWWLW